MSKYRIITFDGGGIKGALTINLLKRLYNRFPKLIETTELFAGTSTGSFIALGLAYGKSPHELAKLFSLKNAKFIFSPTHLNLFRPRYDNKHLIHLLHSVFPADLKLKDLKHHVIIPSFRITNSQLGYWNPVFFNNFPNSNTKDEYVIDVALASSAAPTYFPSYQQYIDGGVIVNNPSTAAIAMAKDNTGGGKNLDNMYLLSLGTGFNPNQIRTDTKDWGILEWTVNPSPPPNFPILNILTNGVAEADVHFSSQLLGNQYFRLNPTLNHPISIDDYRKVPILITLARNFNLKPTIDWIKENWV